MMNYIHWNTELFSTPTIRRAGTQAETSDSCRLRRQHLLGRHRVGDWAIGVTGVEAPGERT